MRDRRQARSTAIGTAPAQHPAAATIPFAAIGLPSVFDPSRGAPSSPDLFDQSTAPRSCTPPAAYSSSTCSRRVRREPSEAESKSRAAIRRRAPVWSHACISRRTSDSSAYAVDSGISRRILRPTALPLVEHDRRRIDRADVTARGAHLMASRKSRLISWNTAARSGDPTLEGSGCARAAAGSSRRHDWSGRPRSAAAMRASTGGRDPCRSARRGYRFATRSARFHRPARSTRPTDRSPNAEAFFSFSYTGVP